LESQKKFFDDAALRYGSQAILVPGACYFRNIVLDKAMRKALTPVLKRFKRLNILEVGCGVGRWMKIMAEENSVIGVDVSRFMIKLARNKCKGKRCSFVVADASFLPFKENIFDLVVSITVLQHLPSEQQLLRVLSEIARCGKLQALIVEEMWSAQVTLLQRVYCPIRILPLESYIRNLLIIGYRPFQCIGITPAMLTVRLLCFLASRPKIVNSNLTARFTSSRLLSGAAHFTLGAITLSSVFAPVGNYNPRLSLHTVLAAKKIIEEKNLNRKNDS
jgi:SAM-dependent methyltransferase